MKRLVELSIVDHTSNLSIWETEVDHGFEAKLSYISRLCLQTTKAKMRKLAVETKHVPGEKGSIFVLGTWWDSGRQTSAHMPRAIVLCIIQ